MLTPDRNARAQAGRMAAGDQARGELAAKLRAAASVPVLRRELLGSAVKVAGIELLRNGRFFLVRARSIDGAVGPAEGHGPVLESAWPILVRRVAPFFTGKD